MNEKIENLLNVAVNIEREDMEKSQELFAGYQPETDIWHLIVRYTGDLDFLDQYERVAYTILSNNFAILEVPQPFIQTIADNPNIIYIEKPKPLYFQVVQNRNESCVSSVQNQYGLYGEGVIIAIIDSGIDYTHSAFLTADGKTRILSLWDQSIDGNPPQGFHVGTEYRAEQINDAIATKNIEERNQKVPSWDFSGHGTHVAGIAAGNFANNKENDVGIATRSELLIVKLASPDRRSFATTVELMEAVDYVVKKAQEYNRPLVINLSFGNNYGSHDGTSLMETYLNEIAMKEQITLVIGTGNEGSGGGHTSGILKTGEEMREEIAVAGYQKGFNIQIWKSYADIFDIELISPSGRKTDILREENEIMKYNFSSDDTQLFVYYGGPKPYSPYQEIYIEFLPIYYYISEGIWTVRVHSERTVIGRYDMWLPTEMSLGTNTRFLYPTPEITLTIPSTAMNAITVGAYDSVTDAYADFSGRGFTRETNQIKPELVAPGVNILSAESGGGTSVKSGTSMATPFVAGAAALLMEWGIIRKHDMYLYGQKVKAYLTRGARQLPGEITPSNKTGYGALCLKNSIPLSEGLQNL